MIEIFRDIIELEQTKSEAPDTSCPQCNESNPANFETCWSCAGDLKSRK